MIPEVENRHLPTPAQEEKPSDVPISGRFDQYRSSFWAAALAIVGVRYAPRPFLKVMGWWDGDKEPHPDFKRKHAYSAIAGSVMEAVTLYFANHTRKDMHSIFDQALAWEFDKEPNAISFSDFRRSHNTMVQQTVGNYINRNLWRFGVNLAFFTPYILGPLLKNKLKGRWHPDNWPAETGADLGLGANAVYLFSDVISRKSTPFEALQTMIDLKINHANNFSDKIVDTDLLDIYERHAANGAIVSFKEHRDTPEWNRSMAIFTRIADLMNQTYGNTAPKGKADFTIAKFIYLVGHKLIQPEHVEQTLAFIEIANHHGIPALKKVVKEMQNGADLAQMLQQYPIAACEEAKAEQPVAATQPAVSQYAASPRPLADRVSSTASYVEKTSQATEIPLGMGA